MPVFGGEVWLVGDAASRVSATVRIVGGRVLVDSGGVSIGDWDRSEVSVRPLSDGYHLTAEGEELVFMTDAPGFVSALTGDGTESALAARLRAAAASPLANAAPPSSTNPPPTATSAQPVQGNGEQRADHRSRLARHQAPLSKGTGPRLSNRLAGALAAVIALAGLGVVAAMATIGRDDPQEVTAQSIAAEGSTAAPSRVSTSGDLAATTTRPEPATSSTTDEPTTVSMTATSAPAVPASTTTTAKPPTTTAPTTTTTTAPPAPSGATEIFGNGTYLVNRDILAGTWEAWPTNSSCVWARLSGVEFVTANIIEFGGLPSGGNVSSSVTVQIAPTDVAFFTQNCGRWARIG